MWWKAAKATPENVEKTRKGLISKSNFARAAHFFSTFLCRCFARLQRETSRNLFMEEISYVFSFSAAHFLLALVDASISHFVTAATKFSCSSNQKMSPLFFISHSRSLSPFFSLSFAGLPATFSSSLSFSCSIYIPNLWTWQLIQAKYFRQHGYRNNFRFPFSSLLSFSCLCFTRRGWLCDFPPK